MNSTVSPPLTKEFSRGAELLWHIFIFAEDSNVCGSLSPHVKTGGQQFGGEGLQVRKENSTV